MAVVRSFMDYRSPAMGWNLSIAYVSPVIRHVRFLVVVISRDQAEAQGLLLSHHRNVNGLCCFVTASPLLLCIQSQLKISCNDSYSMHLPS